MKSKKIAIVVARFNSDVTENLLQCCLDVLHENGATGRIEIKRVPGAYELPFAAQQLAKTGHYAAIIGLGCVIKGETSHDHFVANWASMGLGIVSLSTNVPCFFGVLTPNNEKQARARSKKGPLNRGAEVAMAALEVLGWKGLR